MQANRIIQLAALLGILSVALGAFGAHGLKSVVEPPQVETFTTGVRYQFYHTFAIALASILALHTGFSTVWLGRAVWAWGIGILLFSGSLYLLSLRDVHGLPVSFLGPITPIGGLAFILGWAFLWRAART